MKVIQHSQGNYNKICLLGTYYWFCCITSRLILQVVMMSSVRLPMPIGQNLSSSQGSPAALAWPDTVLLLVPHSQKQWLMLTYPGMLLVVIAGRVRRWKPMDVFVFVGRGNLKVWIPAGLDLHTCTMEVIVLSLLCWLWRVSLTKLGLFRGN